MKQELICINCPRGCHLQVEEDSTQEGVFHVTGNACPRGAAYARQELTDPRRVVTAVVRCASVETPCLPVRTDKPFPKAAIPRLLNLLYGMTIGQPVKLGQIILPDVDGTGINVIATETIP